MRIIMADTRGLDYRACTLGTEGFGVLGYNSNGYLGNLCFGGGV